MSTDRRDARKPVIAVLGGTGQQGGSVVNALLDNGEFAVRVATRNRTGDSAKALAARGVDVVEADLLDPRSLQTAFDGAYGAFVVTNFWDPQQMSREVELATAAARTARAAGVDHLVWSTLPDVEKCTGGRLKVPHFSDKARVDAAVAAAGFLRHTFVQAPFYYQNLLGPLKPQALYDGHLGWAVAMDPAARVIDAADVADVGRTVAAAFGARDKLANGSYLAVSGGVYSWNDFASALNALGHDLHVHRVSPDAFDADFLGAREAREMFEYCEAFTYFGPEREKHISATSALIPQRFIGFDEWARRNMMPRAAP